MIKRKTNWTGKTKTEVCDRCNPQQEMGPEMDLKRNVYYEHLKMRQIVITDVITDEMIDSVALQIMKFNEEDDELEMSLINYDRLDNPITLKIASVGGSAAACTSILSQIVQSRTPVISVAVGDCSSAAALILLASHYRVASRFSRIMIHSLISGHGDSLQGVLDHAEECKKIQQIFDSLIVERTAITQQKLTELQERKQDWFLSAEEAKELGVVDEVLEIGIPMTPFKERNKPKADSKKKKKAVAKA